MNVLIFGATGATGKHLVRIALAQGHSVTAFVRDPGRLGDSHPALRSVVGDVLRPETVRAALPGHQAVLCAIGTMPEDKADRARRQPDVPVCSRGTKNILDAMLESGCRRIVVESSAGIGDSYGTGRFGAGLLVRTVLRKVMEDKELQEAAVRESPADWTIIRPPKLTNGRPRGHLRWGERLSWNIASTASRADVATFMVRVLGDGATYRRALTVKA